jgi:hypothetical protein
MPELDHVPSMRDKRLVIIYSSLLLFFGAAEMAFGSFGWLFYTGSKNGAW